MPNCGEEGEGSTAPTIKDRIRSSWCEMIEDGTADSVTAFLRTNGANGVAKAALYEHLADDNAGALLGETEQLSINQDGFQFYTFNFNDPKPSLVNATKYFITVWGKGDGNIWVRAVSLANKSVFLDLAFNGWPDPLAGEAASSLLNSIFFTYSVGGNGAPPPSGAIEAMPILKQ